MGVSISIGEYATNPYLIDGIDISVSSIEELCYCFKENAVLLDRSIIQRSLVEWIEKELVLSELAHSLYPLVERQGSLESFVGNIMEYVGIYDYYTIQDVREILRKGAGLSTIERYKNQIDYLFSKKKYKLAAVRYLSLIDKWNSIEVDKSSVLPGLNVLVSIWNNLGCAYGMMLDYKKAAWAFEQCYQLSGHKEYLLRQIAAKRLEMSDSDYVAYIANIDGAYEASMVLERKLQNLKHSWEDDSRARELSYINELRLNGDDEKYETLTQRILEGIKEDYRDSVWD